MPLVHKVLLSALLVAALPKGCQCGNSSRTIYAVPRDLSAPSTCEHAGAASEAARRHLDIYWNGPSSSNEVEEQVRLVERAVQQQSYGLIVSPNNRFALNAAISRAVKEDIPVVVLGAPVPLRPTAGLSFVLSQFDQATDDAAAYLARVLPTDSEVMIVGGNDLSPGSSHEEQIFIAAMQRHAPSLHILEQESAPVFYGQTQFSTENALRTHPKLRAIFSLNFVATGGAVAAVMNMNAQDKVHILGCDQTLNLVSMLRRGQIDGLIVQDMPQMAEIAVRQIAAGRERLPMKPQVFVPAKFVTTDNVDDNAVQQAMRMDWRLTP